MSALFRRTLTALSIVLASPTLAHAGSALSDCDAWPEGCRPDGAHPRSVARTGGGPVSARTTVYASTPPTPTVHPHNFMPRVDYVLEGGVGAFGVGPFGFQRGVGAVTLAGGAWGARIAAELFPWMMLEGRYLGTLESTVGGAALLTHSTSATLRATLPLHWVQPYMFAGLGYYETSLTGDATARQISPLHSSANVGFPVGVGVDVRVTEFLSLGTEATYHAIVDADHSGTASLRAGDLMTLTMVLRARL